jgi:hypothetical protein
MARSGAKLSWREYIGVVHERNKGITTNNAVTRCQ